MGQGLRKCTKDTEGNATTTAESELYISDSPEKTLQWKRL